MHALGRRAALVIAALAIGSCGNSSPSSELSFEFELTASSGFIGETLTIESRGRGLAPTLEITPLDAAGDRVPGVTVRSAFGSDRGRVVVPPSTAVIDELRFKGSRARDVRDVSVRVVEADEVVGAVPVTDAPAVQHLDRRGRMVDYGKGFDSFRLFNGNDAPVSVRAVLLEYDDPPPGEPQQTTRVTAVSGLVRLAGQGAKIIRLPDRVRGRVAGIVKAYFSR